MADVNMLSQLYDDFIIIVRDSVIKYKAKADELDTLEMTKAADEYVRAAQKKDTFGNYYYTKDEIIEAFEKGSHSIGDGDYQVSESEIDEMVASRFSIPPLYEKKRTLTNPYTGETYEEVLWTYDLRTALVELHRADIISKYEEKNNYYRMLMGLPDYGTSEDEYLYVPRDIADEYNIDTMKPIHELDIGQMSVLYTIGYIDTLIEKYPDRKYLQYLGSKAVDNVTARSAKAFDIIRVPSVSSATMWNSFSLIYSQCREYFMSCIYVGEHRQTISYYDNFIAMCIMLMTLLQFIARILKFTIERDFFDEYCVKTLFACYNIPYDSALDNDTKLQIVQNLNLLVRDKGTNKVLVDIASILGFDRIKIFKYCLFKDQIFDESGLPVVATKKNEITGEEEPDYEKMYKVSFKKLDVNSNDYYHVLQTNSVDQSYQSVTEADPYWINDENLMKDLYDIEYNYAETKYMGISISYRMTRLFFDNVYSLKMLLDNRFKEYTIFLDLPKILTYQSISLFDSVMLLCALTCKMNHLRGNILSSPSKILHVMGFDFKKGFEILKEHMNEDDPEHPYAHCLDPDLAKYFTIVTDAGPYTAEQLNSLYGDMLSLYDFLLDKMSTCKTIEEYRAYRDLYYALYYCEEYQDVFTIGDDKVFTDWDMITADVHTKRGWVLAHVDTEKNAEDCLVTDKTRISTCYYISNLIKDASDCIFHPATNSAAQIYEFDSNGVFVRTFGDFTHNEKIEFVPIRGHKYYISMEPSYDADTLDIDGREGKTIFEDELVSMVNGCRLEIKARYAGTFMEYLMYRNPALWSFVESCDINMIPQYANHIINKLLKILPDVQMLGQSLGYSSIMEDVLLKFIRFFKSYTVDLLNMEVVYILDMKPESMMRLLDSFTYYTEHWLKDKMTMGYVDMEDHTIYETIATKFKFYEGIDVSVMLHLFGSLTWMDEIHKIKDYIWKQDTLKLTDGDKPQYIADYIWLKSFCRLTDDLYYESLYRLYDNHILFRDEAWVSFVEMIAEDHDFGFYDFISNYIKNIYLESGFNFSDECATNLRHLLSDNSMHLRDEVFALKITEMVRELDFIMYDLVAKYSKEIANSDYELSLKDTIKWTPVHIETDRYHFDDEAAIKNTISGIISKIKFIKDTVDAITVSISPMMGGSLRLRDSLGRDYQVHLKVAMHYADTILSIMADIVANDTSLSYEDKVSLSVNIEKLRTSINVTDAINGYESDIARGDSVVMRGEIPYIDKYYGKDDMMDLNFYYDSIGSTMNDKVETSFGFSDKCIYRLIDNPDD